MKKDELKRIIAEEIATINDDAIEDTVMGILSDEGGAAGIEPIEAALEDLETEDMELPDESIEDIIASVAGVKRHADGDYIDTTQLEGRSYKITKSQLQKIIAEEYELLEKRGRGIKISQEQIDGATAGFLYGLSRSETAKNALADFLSFVGSKPNEIALGIADKMCDAMGSYDFGEYSTAADQACRTITRGMANFQTAGFKMIFKGFAFAARAIPSDLLREFVADTYPNTTAGRMALADRARELEDRAMDKKERLAKIAPPPQVTAESAFKSKIRNLVEMQMTPDSEVMDRLKDGLMAVALDRIVNQGDNILESEVISFVRATSTNDVERIYDAMERLALQLNV